MTTPAQAITEKIKPKLEFKESYNPIVPLYIFQTWQTRALPPKMWKNVERLKRMHPRFKHFLYDDNACRAFMKKFFEGPVANAYDRLIPGAYKADLWRYCILYIYGGIYLDIKYRCVNDFRLIALTESEHFPQDVPPSKEDYPGERYKGVWNGLLVCLPGNQKLLQAINNIVYNVKHYVYGKSPLCPTGPFLLGKYVSEEEKKNAQVKRYMKTDYNGASFMGVPILTEYAEYRTEQNILQTHYSILWGKRQIYKNPL